MTTNAKKPAASKPAATTKKKAAPAPAEPDDTLAMVRMHEEAHDPPKPPPGPDIGDYADLVLLGRLTMEQLRNELLAMIGHVRFLKEECEFADGDPYFECEKAKGAALKDEWLRRGRTVDELRGQVIKWA